MSHFNPRSNHGVLIVAHGERGGACNNARLLELVDEVRDRLGDVEVEAGVLKGTPHIQDGWSRLSSPNRLVYPFFMSDGFFCNRILPKKIVEAVGAEAGDLTMLPPFGVSSQLACSLENALLHEVAKLGLTGKKPPLLIAAHGASVDRQSSIRAHQLASALSNSGHFGPISCGFLDQAPYLQDMVGELLPNTVVLPHFNGLGSHSVDDMAKLSQNAPDDCHFITPVGAHSWVGSVMTADILRAIEWYETAEAAE